MLSDEQRAALIDAYWAAVARDPSTPPPPKLDPDMAGLVRRLATQARPPDPDDRFVADLRGRLVDAAAARATQRAPATSRWRAFQPTLGWASAARFAAAIALIAVIWGVWGTIDSPSVQAEEIIRQVQAVSTSPATSGIETMTFTELTTYGIDHNVPDGQSPADYRAHRTERQVWYAVPYLLREEERAIEVGPDGREVVRREIVNVSDGITHWSYDAAANAVRIDPSTAARLTNIPAAGADFDNHPNRLLQQQTACLQPELRGKEQVAGREAYLIVFVRICAVRAAQASIA